MMADVCDLANDYLEAQLALAIQAARGIPGPDRPHERCVDCHEPLLEHRLVMGICLPCQECREARGRIG
jgi:anthranilate/para-aminobenzoate synthase component II